MSFLYNNLSAIVVAGVTSLMAWLYGGMHHETLMPTVPWVMLFLLETVFFFPQRRPGESSVEARLRVWDDLKADPLVWTGLGFLFLLALPFVNNGLCPNCDRALIAQGLRAAPPVKFLPFCVNRTHHLDVYAWFLVAFTCLVAVRHCLIREGKRIVLGLIVWNGVALAVLGFFQYATGANGPFWQDGLISPGRMFFSTWGYPNVAGDYFTSLFGISVAVWRWRREDGRWTAEGETVSGSHEHFWKRNIYLIPAGLFFFAAMNTLSRASIMLVSALMVVFFVHTFVSITIRMQRVARVKATAISLLVLGIVAVLATLFMPDQVKEEMNTVDTVAVLDRVTGKRADGVSVATSIWKDHLLFGCGGWGYRHFSAVKVPIRKGEYIAPGGVNVHNDYLQFLAEHGLVGFGCLVAIVLLVLVPVLRTCRRLMKSSNFVISGKRIPQILFVPAPVFCLLLTMTATLIHAFGDCVFRSAAVLTLFAVELAAVSGFLPHETSETEEESPRTHHHIHH